MLDRIIKPLGLEFEATGRRAEEFLFKEGADGEPGHLAPLIKNDQGELVEIFIEQNADTKNACGPQSIIFKNVYNKNIENGKTHDQALITAHEAAINGELVRNFYKQLGNMAKSNEDFKQRYYRGASVQPGRIIAGGERTRRATDRRMDLEQQQSNIDFFDQNAQVNEERRAEINTNTKRKKFLRFDPTGGENEPANQKIFESLQQYHNLESGEQGEKEVLDVTMSMGGKARSFQLGPSPYPSNQRQILIGTLNKDYPATAVLRSYDKIYKSLDSVSGLSFNSDMERDQAVEMLRRERASLVLEAIRLPASEQRVWEEQFLEFNGTKIPVFNEQQIRACVELISITQVAEAAPPSQEFYKTLISSEQQSSFSKPSGRVPANDKQARASLQLIADGKSSFENT